MSKFTLRSAVHLFLVQGEQVLLLRRYKTGWKDGWYSVPAGHIEGNETITDSTIRETQEETGIELRPENIRVVHTMHRRALDTEYIDFFISAEKWSGQPKIMEPDKCDELSWHQIDALPENTLKYIRHALACYQKGVTFSEFGWSGDAE